MEITPSTLMSMYGYSNRKCGPANGTHDPLFAKVLVLEKDEDLVRVKHLLLKQGLKPFIRESPTLARVLAAVGLMNTISAELSTILALSGAFLKLKPDEVRDSIDQLRTHNGLPLLIGSEDKVFALL